MIPTRVPLNAYQGATFETTITLVSGNSTLPVNLTNFGANFVAGPYLNLLSASPTVSGNVSINGPAGQIFLTISGTATGVMYQPQQYYLKITFPDGNTGYLINGTINFVNPYNSVSGPNIVPFEVGPNQITIEVMNFEDFV